MEVNTAAANSQSPTNQSASRRSSQIKSPTERRSSIQDDSSKGTKASQEKPSKSKDVGEAKLSPAELKKKAKEEKAARRVKEKEARQGAQGGPPAGEILPDKSKGHQRRASGAANEPASPTSKQQQQGQHRQRKPSVTFQNQKQLPMRSSEASNTTAANTTVQKKPDSKKVALFSHLYTNPRRHTIANAAKDVHPSVLALGLQMSSYTICGSNARCVATLLTFKRVIDSYITPPGNSLPRHLPTVLSSQIEYLTTCRPLSVSMGNAIRWLKVKISEVDPDIPEETAKVTLCSEVDNFINERITVADTVIADFTCSKIQDKGEEEEEVILTYGKSSTVQHALHQAFLRGKKFSVIVVDSRPLFEGRNLARALVKLGIQVQYTLAHAINHVIRKATKVLLGAHAMMSNGRLYSRVGTALVAMVAKEASVPVIVLCESIKFTDRVALDSIVHNEVAPADELIPLKSLGGGKETTHDGEEAMQSHSLSDWRDVPNLHLLNLMYDLTPAECLNVIITEYGFLPPSSVPVVHRLSIGQGA